MYCIVQNCRSVWRPNSTIKFHSFPKDIAKRNTWLSSIPIKGKFYISAKICNLHFKKEDYDPEKPGHLLHSAAPFCIPHLCDWVPTMTKMEKDTNHYVKYKMGFSSKILLTDEAVPSKFHCQEDLKHRLEDPDHQRAVIAKRKRMELPKQFQEGSHVQSQDMTEAAQNDDNIVQEAIEPDEVTEMEMPADVLETDSYINEQCCGCLKRVDVIVLKQFNIQCQQLKDILKLESIILCYVCEKIARKAEYFIQNVLNNQIHLQNYEPDIPESKQCLPPTTLTQISLPPVELPAAGEEESCTVMSSEVKVEQLEDANEDYDGIFIKEEYTSHNLQPKEEVTSEEDSCSQNSPEIERKGKRKVMDTIIPGKRKIMLVKTCMSASSDAYEIEYTIERVTEKQCMKEREQRSHDSRYLSSIYRCGDCIKGYMHKTSFDMHMKLHSLSRGDFVCEICKQRFESAMKMAAHKKCHIYRYNCTKCDVNRISQSAIRSHYAAKHSSFGSTLHQCTICPKVFKNKVSLRKHEHAHSRHERVTCDSCQLTFISKDTLRNHILRKHPPDGFLDINLKRHVCQQCGMAFKAPYLLNIHAAMHTENRPYYCVECDKSFKTDKILTRHLKTASRHVFNADLHVSCDQCEKRFTCRRDLERHVNSAHLNLRPYACDKCDKAYLNSWSLREHKMYSHEGYRKERRYPCTLCDKVFDRISILKSHIRTHTGERPYRCTHCPSQFVQSSQLRTHTNLVHLKLTRDGKPKSTALK